MECLRYNFTDGVILDGRYQTLAPLNHGSFGMVFMAKDLQSGDTVAIKCLTKRSAAADSAVDFAIDDKSEELVLHSRLATHPNIVNLTHSFETDAHIYLVLEFCPRGDLYEAIRNGHGPLETEHVRRFMLELVDAVQYIHDKGVYHRDIKPENIFITQSGAMKLGDFGLATTDKWTYETTVGSDRYMSPEQYDSAGAGYSPAQADIWAIGICMLNILFSRNPFTAPTESDPLFLDFSRDKQSLFDVFPSMSQDTYEIIVECMNLDPTKRSLVGAREALERAVAFTTDDEALDDFDYAARRGIPDANREPLRTPSIQSPHIAEGGAFPWAKALQTTPPQAIRQLSAIPDDESYSEDLFSKSEETDWSAATGPMSPNSSLMVSSLGASMMSLNMNHTLAPPRRTARTSPMAGSLPITMNKPRQSSAMSMVFGRKDQVSKSWSDMWDEDEEEEEVGWSQQLPALEEINSRPWSRASMAEDFDETEDTPRQGLSPLPDVDLDSHAVQNVGSELADDSDGNDFFFDEELAVPSRGVDIKSSPKDASTSDSDTASSVDKWAALGERRRAFADSPSSGETLDVTYKAQRPVPGSQGFSTLGHSVWGQYDASQHTQPSNAIFSRNNNPASINGTKWPHHGTPIPTKDRTIKECPWSKGRSRPLGWRKDKRHDFFGDFEWVGNLQEARS